MDELVSVIIPVYNVENYLKKCVESLLKQTYQRLEIILVDDGSTDLSGRICDEFSGLDGRIKVFHKENGGLSDARNFGLQHASGEFVTFVDSDDIVSERYVEVLMNGISDYGAEISICNFKMFFSESELQMIPQNKASFQKILSNIDALAEIYGPLYVQFTVAWGKLYKRSLFEGIKFPVGRLHEDEFTTYRLLWRAKRIVYTDEKLYFYRQRPGSIMSSFNMRRSYDSIEAMKERVEFFKENGLKDLAILTEKRLFWSILAYLNRSGQTEITSNYEHRKFLKLELINLIKHSEIRNPLFRFLMLVSVPLHSAVYQAYRLYNAVVLKFRGKNVKAGD
uniref:Glycosyltransferase n=1 Tax=Fervidobacterium thailandense TaxID=1008305 RepID=A0A7C4RW58_9BACT